METNEMKRLKLRGYVVPDDIGKGSDTEKLQRALYLSVKEDIRKVVVDKNLKLSETVKIPAGVELKFAEGVKVVTKADPMFTNEVATIPEKASWSFEDKWIYLLGEKKVQLKGNIKFYHAGNVVVEDLFVDGTVSFEFSREVRMERNTIRTKKDAALLLMRGCNNYIVQYNTLEAGENACVLDASLEEGPYVIGKDTDIHEIIVRANTMNAKTAMFVGASKDSGVFNVQYDTTKTNGTGIVIGHEGEKLDKKRYFNITSTEHECMGEEKILNNEVKHCFFGE